MKRILIAALMLGACGLLAQNQVSRVKSGELKNETGIEFVQIQRGDFMMGCSAGDIDCNADERPVHRVQITKPFQLGKFEVTQAQWQSVMGSNPSTVKGDEYPVETVNKNEAHEFLNRLNAKHDGFHYRLPTEAEWEYAARAGSATAYVGKLDEIAWYGDNSEDTTHPVGQKRPNTWGLFDMEGNVKEWVEDLYSANYYRNSPAADPTGPQQAGGGGRGGRFGRRGPPPNGDGGFGGFGGFGGRRGRFGGPPPGRAPADGAPQGGPPQDGRGGLARGLPVMRGGAWDNPATYVRVSARYSYYGPTLRVSDVGFRVVREPEVNQ